MILFQCLDKDDGGETAVAGGHEIVGGEGGGEQGREAKQSPAEQRASTRSAMRSTAATRSIEGQSARQHNSSPVMERLIR